jgi:hypothetical protein
VGAAARPSEGRLRQGSKAELVWAVVLKLDVPADLVDLLIALHKVVDVHFEVDGVTHVLESIIGVKQGDILGPVLFNFIIWLRGG